MSPAHLPGRRSRRPGGRQRRPPLGPGVVIGTSLLPAHRRRELEGVDRAERIAWAKLTAESVRLSHRVPGAEHAELVRAALRSGQPLQRWAIEHLLAAARAELG
jgi:hypothetical protein